MRFAYLVTENNPHNATTYMQRSTRCQHVRLCSVWYVMLCYVMLGYVMLGYVGLGWVVVLCWVVLWYGMVWYGMLVLCYVSFMLC